MTQKLSQDGSTNIITLFFECMKSRSMRFDFSIEGGVCHLVRYTNHIREEWWRILQTMSRLLSRNILN